MSETHPEDLKEAVRFHGHLCPGLVIGYRAAKVAAAALQTDRAEDEELVAIVETDACSVDAVQVLLGCTLGKGNLLFRDHGKQAFTVISRKQNRGIRIAVRANAMVRTAEQEALLTKARSGTAFSEEEQAYGSFQKARVDEILHMPEDDLFDIAEIAPEVPQKATIFKSVVCHYCGERVMEPRARIRDGEIACIPCSEVYGRGW